MKRIMCRFTYSTAVAITAVFFCMAIILASPLSSKAQSGSPGAKKESRGEGVEARISEFHSKLKITPAQEEQWTKVAQVMRDNAAAMEAVIKERQAMGENLTAIEDLTSYAKIADAHAAGLHNFIPVFEPLYATMSDDQKKNADRIFTKRHKARLKKK